MLTIHSSFLSFSPPPPPPPPPPSPPPPSFHLQLFLRLSTEDDLPSSSMSCRLVSSSRVWFCSEQRVQSTSESSLCLVGTSHPAPIRLRSPLPISPLSFSLLYLRRSFVLPSGFHSFTGVIRVSPFPTPFLSSSHLSG